MWSPSAERGLSRSTCALAEPSGAITSDSDATATVTNKAGHMTYIANRPGPTPHALSTTISLSAYSRPKLSKMPIKRPKGRIISKKPGSLNSIMGSKTSPVSEPTAASAR